MTGGRERRRFERVRSNIQFHCYVDGHRFDSSALDVSAAGALLRTSDEVRDNAIVMIVPKDEARRDFPVMLIGTVVRAQQKQGERALALRWIRCITRRGIEAIYSFVAAYPEFSQLTLPPPPRNVQRSSVVGYDFQENRFYVPKITKLAGQGATLEGPSAAPEPTATPPAAPPPVARHTGSSEVPPKKDKTTQPTGTGEAALRTPVPPRPAEAQPRAKARASLSDFFAIAPGHAESKESGVITQTLRIQEELVPCKLPVSFTSNELEFTGTLRLLSLTSLFIETPADLCAMGTMIEVTIPVPVRREHLPVTVVGSVDMIGLHPELPHKGVSVRIVAVKKTSRPGVFERYVKYLYYRMLTDG